MTEELRRSLNLGDLVLAQILVIVSLGSVGPAARLGSLHWVYWLVAVVIFQIPLAIVVMHLTRSMPLEGGPYHWSRAAYGDFAGFMAAWNLFHFLIVFISMLGMTVTAAVGYASGAGEAWMSNRGWQVAISAIVTVFLMTLAIAGLGAAKWLHNVAAIAIILTAGLLIVLPFFSRPPYVAAESDSFSLMQLLLFTRVGVWSLSGFECMSILVGECRGGARMVTRSIAIAVPCIAVMYILGTQSILTFVAPKDVDLVNPAAQAFSVALGPLAAVIFLLVVRDVAQSSLGFTALTRLPLVAGWDHRIPRWFTHLHPRTKTPVNAILYAAALTFASSLAAITFAGRQEAFQVLLSTAGVLFASTYLLMFFIPLRTRAPLHVRIAAFSGFTVTAAFLVLNFVPIVDVVSPLRYAAAIAIAVLAVNLIGWSVFKGYARARSATAGDTGA